MKAVACVYEYDEKILLLHRVRDDKWGVVGGKVEPADSSFLDALMRESEEEVGFSAGKDDYTLIGSQNDCLIYHSKLHSKPVITLNKEHTKYVFVEPTSAPDLNLSEGLELVIKKLQKNPL